MKSYNSLTRFLKIYTMLLYNHTKHLHDTNIYIYIRVCVCVCELCEILTHALNNFYDLFYIYN